MRRRGQRWWSASGKTVGGRFGIEAGGSITLKSGSGRGRRQHQRSGCGVACPRRPRPIIRGREVIEACDRERGGRRRRSCGNGVAWKAWKSKTGIPTLSTPLGNLANGARFPHSHSSDDEYMVLFFLENQPAACGSQTGDTSIEVTTGTFLTRFDNLFEKPVKAK